MTKSISFFSLALFQISCIAVHGQEGLPVVDIAMLQNQLQYIKEDTSGIGLLNNLAAAFYHNNENDSCEKYAVTAMGIANRLLNTEGVKSDVVYNNRCKILKAEAIENIGNTLYYKNTRAAIDTFKAALKLRSESGSKKGMGDDYFNIAYLHYVQNDHVSAEKYYQLSLTFFEETNDKSGIGMAYNWKAINHRDMGKYGDALESNLSAFQIGRQIRDSTIITDALLAMGFIYLKVRNYEEALKNQKAALKIFTATHDSAGIATVYNDMGVTNAALRNMDVALKNHLSALSIRKQLKQYGDMAASHNYISNIYEMLGKYQDALSSCLEGVRYARLNGDIRYISTAYISAGGLYLKMFDDENALNNYYKALDLAHSNNANSIEAEASEKIALIYLKQDKTKEAITWLNKAAAIALPGDYIILQTIYKSLSLGYAKINDYSKAYESHVKYKQFSDAAASIEKTEKLTSLTHQLEFENRRALQKASQDKQLAVQLSEIERQKLVGYVSMAGLLVVIVFAIILFMRFREKRKLNVALEKSITELKSAQFQLVHSEKMASLGELTAGIAHEIQNPLNFVNNFSELSNEMLDEMKTELATGNLQLATDIADDLKQNLEKINHHGKRADSIVKGMLQHSRSSTGRKEPTDLNKLADEYLRLSYHGLRAKDKEFNADFSPDLDRTIGNINVVPQDIGRVLLNLFNNAFYTVNERRKNLSGLKDLTGLRQYQPQVKISTRKLNDKIEIRVEDNGSGIPQKIIDKIFQPFFTTKPTGQGTGLGLSLSYDIVKAHGGEIKVESTEGKGSQFSVLLPVKINE